jgi:hypothetical protein
VAAWEAPATHVLNQAPVLGMPPPSYQRGSDAPRVLGLQLKPMAPRRPPTRDENGRKNLSPVSVSAFYHRKWDRVRNSRERKRERDKRNCENERKRKY